MNTEEREKRLGDVPYYGANGLQGYIDNFIFDEPLILIAEDGGYFDEFATRPIAYRIAGRSWVNNHAHVLRARQEFCQDAVFYTLEHKDIQPFIVGGTRAKLNQRALRSITVELPTSIPEQAKIAEVLSTVDRAIEQTEALIAKQQRIKTGLLQDLLTRGIDEHGNLRTEETHQFKDSPLGRIPVEWDVVKLDEVITEILDNRGRTPPLDESGTFELIEISALRNGERNPDFTQISKRVSDITFRHWFRQHLEHGDILISTVGTVGLSAYIDEPRGAIAQNLIGLRVDDLNCSEYIFYWTRSAGFHAEIGKVVMDAVQPSLKRPHLLTFQMPRPPLNEQRAISQTLNCIIRAVCDGQCELLKLRSLKTALMQDLLTGEVRVTPLLTEPQEVSA